MENIDINNKQYIDGDKILITGIQWDCGSETWFHRVSVIRRGGIETEARNIPAYRPVFGKKQLSTDGINYATQLAIKHGLKIQNNYAWQNTAG